MTHYQRFMYIQAFYVIEFHSVTSVLYTHTF